MVRFTPGVSSVELRLFHFFMLATDTLCLFAMAQSVSPFFTL